MPSPKTPVVAQPFLWEAFDAEGALITQVFGVLRDETSAEAWNALMAELEETFAEAAA